MKLEFLASKWAITEHFKEYLLYQPFLVRTDNNPLTYIMSTPNLDATGHHWVSALAKYDFGLEYQKGQDNAVADTLSRVTTHLKPEAVQAVLDGATVGASQRAERNNHHQKQPMIGTGGASHCWASLGRNACHQLGSSSKRGP